MKKLGIDARLYYQTGVGTYIRNLLYFLQKKQFAVFYPVLFVMQEDYGKLKKEISEFEIVSVSARWHSFQEQTSFLYDLTKHSIDLMHFTYFSYPFFYGRRYISTVHDLTPLLFKTGKASTKSSLVYQTKYNVYKLLLQNQIRRSEKIVTPTQTVKKQIVAQFGTQVKEKIIPIYEGMDESLLSIKADANIIKKYNLHNYFLYVGNFYPHKNVETLIKAFSQVSDKYSLVLAGPDDYFANKMKEVTVEYKLDNRVIMIHNTNKAQLKALYSGAQALVHASLSEGFGLPLVEAAFLDVPVIASSIDVYKELFGANYVAFDPVDAKDIANKVTRFIEKKPIFDYRTVRKKFSFEKMAQEHYEVYTALLS